MQEFKKVNRRIMNINDPSADMDNLKNNLDNLLDDIDLIRMASGCIYEDCKIIKKGTCSNMMKDAMKKAITSEKV